MTGPYAKSWRRYKTLKLVPYLLMIVMLVLIQGLHIDALLGVSWEVLYIPLIALFIFLQIRLNNWPCPRCGEKFADDHAWHSSEQVSHCAHCDLPKYAADDGEAKGS